MRNKIKIVSLLGVLFICLSCSSKKDSDEGSDSKGVTAVTITHVGQGIINDQITISATTSYQKKIVIASPISGFVTKVFVAEGNRTKIGQTLFTIESKEHQALGKDATPNLGLVSIKSTFDGIITKVDLQEGSYVSEGSQLCSIADRNSFVFLLNVPYTYSAWIKKGKKCTLVMPDNTQLTATIGQTLTTMNTESQTQAVEAHAKTNLLSEGLVVNVLLDKDTNNKPTQILPANAVQANESLSDHWIMKLVNDSLAVKVPVTIGNRNKDDVEILSPLLSPTDRIVSTGGYQLPDSAKVTVEN